MPTLGSRNVQSSIDLAERAGLQRTHSLGLEQIPRALQCLTLRKARGAGALVGGGDAATQPSSLHERHAERSRLLASANTVADGARQLDVIVQAELRRMQSLRGGIPRPSLGEDAEWQHYGIPCGLTR